MFPIAFILFIWMPHVNSGGITTYEFHDKASCEAALNTLITSSSRLQGVCVPKAM